MCIKVVKLATINYIRSWCLDLDMYIIHPIFMVACRRFRFHLDRSILLRTCVLVRQFRVVSKNHMVVVRIFPASFLMLSNPSYVISLCTKSAWSHIITTSCWYLLGSDAHMAFTLLRTICRWIVSTIRIGPRLLMALTFRFTIFLRIENTIQIVP